MLTAGNHHDPTLPASASDRVVEILRYWLDIRGRRAMPRRRDFDPIDVPHHLPGLLLIDVEGVDRSGAEEDGVGLYRFRVVGTAEVARRGFDPTGKPVSESHFGPSLEAAMESYETVRRTGSFLYEPLNFVTADHLRVDEDSILLPFSEDGETVSQILIYSECRDPR